MIIVIWDVLNLRRGCDIKEELFVNYFECKRRIQRYSINLQMWKLLYIWCDKMNFLK